MTQIWTPGQGMVLPPGKAAGLLPRKNPVGTHAKLFREAFETMSIAECDRICRERKADGLAGLDNVEAMIGDQDGIGSCAVEQTRLALELTSKRMGMVVIEVNPWPNYYKVSGGVDRGSTLGENVEFAKTHGFVKLADWPRYDSAGRVVHRWNDVPPASMWDASLAPDEVYEVHPDNYFLEIATGLTKGFVAGIGWDSHSELMYEYDEGGYAKVANSWGKSWNGNGTHRESIKKVNMGYGAFLWRTVKQR